MRLIPFLGLAFILLFSSLPLSSHSARASPSPLQVISSSTISLNSTSSSKVTNFNPSTIANYVGKDLGAFSMVTSPTGFQWNVTKTDTLSIGLPTVNLGILSNSLVFFNTTVTQWALTSIEGPVTITFAPNAYSAKISIQVNLLLAEPVCIPFMSPNSIVHPNGQEQVIAGNERFSWADIPAAYSPTWSGLIFSLCMNLPSGITNIDPLALDGSGTGSCTSPCTSVPASLTTTSTNDAIIVYLGGNCGGASPAANTVTDTSSLSWTKRIHLFVAGFTGWVDEFYAESASTLSSDTITAHLSGCGSANMAIVVFGISGAATSSFFDSNGGLPYTGHCSGGGCGVSVDTVTGVTTSNANDILISGDFNGNGGGAFSGGSGFTIIASQPTGGGGETSSEYKVVSATQSSITVTYAGGDSDGFSYGMIVDAIKSAATTVSVAIKITPSNGAPSPSIGIAGCAPSNSSFTGNPNFHTYTLTSSCTVTLSNPAAGLHSQYTFNVSPKPHESNSLTFQTPASGSSTYQNTTYLMNEENYTFTPTTSWDAAYKVIVSGTSLGTFFPNDCSGTTINGGGAFPVPCFLDYNTQACEVTPVGNTWNAIPPNCFFSTTANNIINVNFTQSTGGAQLIGGNELDPVVPFIIGSVLVLGLIVLVAGKRNVNNDTPEETVQ